MRMTYAQILDELRRQSWREESPFRWVIEPGSWGGVEFDEETRQQILQQGFTPGIPAESTTILVTKESEPAQPVEDYFWE